MDRLGMALFGAAAKITNPIDSWVKGIAGGCCYLIAIFGGATPHTKRTFELGELTVNLNLTHSTTFTLTPVTLHIAGAKSAPTLTSTTWYRVEDGRDVMTLVGQGANGYSSLAVWGPSARGNKHEEERWEQLRYHRTQQRLRLHQHGRRQLCT